MGIISTILFTNKNGLFSKKALDVYVQKQAMINSNIANATTPGYKAIEMKPFEQALSRAYKSTKGIKMATTSPKHLSGVSGDLRNFQPQLVKSTEPSKMDGNNVNLDKEITEMNKNLTMYRAVITARSKRGKIIGGAVADR